MNDPIRQAIASMIAPFFFSLLGTGIWVIGNTIVKDPQTASYLASTLLGGAVTSWQRGKNEQTEIRADNIGTVKQD